MFSTKFIRLPGKPVVMIPVDLHASEIPVQGARGSSNATSDTIEVLASDSMINFWAQQRKEHRTKGPRISEVKMFVPRQAAKEGSMR